MGLSTPNKKNQDNGGVSQPLTFDHTLLRVTAGAGINQVRGINNDGSIGNGIPQHVTNVSCSTANANTGTTSNLTVTFRRDPADLAYGGVTVWATGYQGNSTQVQLAAGVDSPVSVVVQNTGESLSLQIQAYGNGGFAPLNTAPTVGVKLPIGGQGYGAGTGNGSPFTIQPAWWNSGDGSNYPWTDSTNGFFATGAGAAINTVKFWMIRIPYTLKVSKLAVRINTGVAASVAGFALYNSSGQVKILSWDAIDTSTSNTSRTKLLNTPVTVAPGVYLAASAGSTLSTCTSESGYVTGGTSEPSRPWNLNGVPRSGTGTNLMVAGVMPGTLGTLAVTTGMATLPCITMEA